MLHNEERSCPSGTDFYYTIFFKTSLEKSFLLLYHFKREIGPAGIFQNFY